MHARHVSSMLRGGFAGPGSAGETALGTWLDNNNGCFFISSQDYRYDRGLTPFMTNYLGAAIITNDSGNYTSVTGQGSVFGGLGPYSLAYPFNDYSDTIAPTVSSELAFQGDNTRGAALNKDSGSYKTTFWVFPWEAIGSAIGRAASLQAFLVDACGITPPNIITEGTFDVTTAPDSVVTRTLTISNTGLSPLDWMIDEDNVSIDIAGPPPACSAPTDIPWVSASPASGTTPATAAPTWQSCSTAPAWALACTPVPCV